MIENLVLTGHYLKLSMQRANSSSLPTALLPDTSQLPHPRGASGLSLQPGIERDVIPARNTRSYTLENAITPVPPLSRTHSPGQSSTPSTYGSPTPSSSGGDPRTTSNGVRPTSTSTRQAPRCKTGEPPSTDANGPHVSCSLGKKHRKISRIACLFCRKHHKACSPSSGSGDVQCK